MRGWEWSCKFMRTDANIKRFWACSIFEGFGVVFSV